jgi:hypothetical protein
MDIGAADLLDLLLLVANKNLLSWFLVVDKR